MNIIIYNSLLVAINIKTSKEKQIVKNNRIRSYQNCE